MTSRVTLVASLGLIHLIRHVGINWTDFVGANTTIGDEAEITIAVEAVRTT